MHEVIIIGNNLNIYLTVMHDLGSMGEKILATNDINKFDADKYYSFTYCTDILDEVYQRFGSDACVNLGFAIGESPMPQLDAVIPIYGEEINKTGLTQKALDIFIDKLIFFLDKNTKHSLHHNDQEYGATYRLIETGIYEIIYVGLNPYESIIEAILTCIILRYISSDWNHNFTFHSEKTISNSKHISFHWTLKFSPKLDRSTSSSELMIAYKLKIKEKLLKKVIEDSNRSWAELDASMKKLDASNKVVVESVNYASRLQRGQLPRQMRIDGRFASFASIWEPRDTIGGDLYWLSSSQQSGPFVLAVADCTGHGVPGAMLSLLVSNSLERIYANDSTEDPATALMSLDHYVRTGLNQDRTDSESDDGCDAAVLRIDRDEKTIEFAGAKLGLFQVNTQGVLTRHQAARCSLGYQDVVADADKPVVQKIPYQSGDVFAVVTDGFTDQIGGSTGKTSFGYRRLEDILKANCTGSAEEIAAAMKLEFAAWQGTNARRDDVTAVVFRL